MKRSDRMAPVQKVLEKAEERAMRELGEARKRLADAEARLGELKAYHTDYLRAFRARAESGQSVTALRDFQAFLARLEQAVAQQEKVVAQAADQVAQGQRSWQGAARQVKAVEGVVERWQQAEEKVVERRDQKDTDERAQRSGQRRES